MKNVLPVVAGWKKASLRDLVRSAKKFRGELATALREDCAGEEIDDARFTAVMHVIIMDYAEDYSTFMRDTYIDGNSARMWVRGKNLPPRDDRKGILEHCIRKIETKKGLGLNILAIITSEAVSEHATLQPPDWDTPLSEVIGWSDLPTLVLNALHNEGVTTFGQAIACTEFEYLRFQHLGRKSLNQLKSWFATFGLSMASRVEDVLPEVVQYRTLRMQ